MLHKFDRLLRDLTYSVLHIRCHCRSNLIAQIFDANALYEKINPCLSFFYSPAMTLMVSRGRKLILLLLSFCTKKNKILPNNIFLFLYCTSMNKGSAGQPLLESAHLTSFGGVWDSGGEHQQAPSNPQIYIAYSESSRLALIPQKCSERGSTDWATCFVKLLEAREAKIGMPAR